MSFPDRPLIVVEGPLADARPELTRARTTAQTRGWMPIKGWAAPLTGERVLCHGVIGDPDAARRALLAAVAGAGIVAHATASRDVVDRFLDDLRRLGPVDHRVPLTKTAETLRERDAALLDELARGLSVADAAASLGIGIRTAERRLSIARNILGVRSNAEAVIAAMARRR